MALAKADIIRLLKRLNEELADADAIGELYLVGGAVMCLVLEARPATRDIDAWFRPARSIRAAAKRVSDTEGVEPDWLNDAVKGYLSPSGTFHPYLDLSNLRVSTATPEYLLAMKCLAMRLGEEFHDEEDVRFLLRYLNVDRFEEALDIIARYYPPERIPQKTLYALEELLGGSAA
jgi:hypothetical protein